MLNRRQLLAGAGAGAGTVLAAPALGQAGWPNRTVTMIVPYGPGSTPDVFTRIIAQRLHQQFGQPFIIENRAGAGANVGAAAVARAQPDGYTIGTVPVGVMTFNKELYRQLTYDPDVDLVPTTVIYEVPNVFVVPGPHPAKSVHEFIEWAKKKNGGVVCSSPGVGNSAHLFCHLFANRGGFEPLHVPYRDGPGGSVPAMLRGDVDFAVEIITGYLGSIRNGSIRALAITGDHRWEGLPDVPTLKELGFSGFNPPPVWVAFAMPKGTPAEIVEKISAAQREYASDPDMQRRFREAGAVIQGTTPQGMRDRIAAQKPAWLELIRLAGAQL